MSSDYLTILLFLGGAVLLLGNPSDPLPASVQQLVPNHVSDTPTPPPINYEQLMILYGSLSGCPGQPCKAHPLVDILGLIPQGLALSPIVGKDGQQYQILAYSDAWSGSPGNWTEIYIRDGMIIGVGGSTPSQRGTKNE